LTDATTAPPFTINSLADSELPETVRLLESYTFKVGDDGTAIAPAGAKLEVHGIKNGTLDVTFVNSRDTIPFEITNLELLVTESRRADEKLKAEQAAQAALARLEQEKALQKEENRRAARQQKLESQFSSWNGSHLSLTRYIKERMNDPDSFEHDETRYIDKGDHLIIITSFRGKNAFGGVVRSTTMAKVDLDGNVLEILSHE
jgi:hypothetical protein